MAELTHEQALAALAANTLVGTNVTCAAIRKSPSQVLRLAKNGTLPAVFSGNRPLFPTAPLLRLLGREDLIPTPTISADSADGAL